jgi:hypothetical protein
MSLLDKYQLNYEALELEKKTWITQKKSNRTLNVKPTSIISGVVTTLGLAYKSNRNRATNNNKGE